MLIIAEVGQAHDGSLGNAHAFIDALANTGVNIIKFQTHIAEAESSIHEPFRIKFSYEDETRYDYWRRMEFSLDQWKSLADHCTEVAIEFMSTPSSLAAVDLLEKVGVKRYKVGSGDVNNLLLLKKIAMTSKPIILSTGMSTIDEIQEALNLIEENGNHFSILYCTSKYPTQPSDIDLDLIEKYKSTFNCPVGFSDHSGTIYPCLAAVALGCDIVEFHVAFDKRMFGPDSTSSLTMDEVKYLVTGIKYINEANITTVDNAVNNNMEKMKSIFGKSLSVNKNLDKGHIITFEDLESKKPPGYGISTSCYQDILGKKLKFIKQKNEFLNFEDLED